MPMPTPTPVKISYKDLLENQADIPGKIQSALGSKEGCLGIIVISDLPSEFIALREKLFHLAQRLATSPDEVKKTLEKPETHYFFGWSHGQEIMNGKPDLYKGSFYANPLLDYPDVSDEQRQKYPEYYAGNVWPGVSELNEFETSFKAIGKIIYDVGLALARACEAFVAETTVSRKTIESYISSSQSNKARLLHYYSESESVSSSSSSNATSSEDKTQLDSLCGTHIDHSLLTGLCSAMYLTCPKDGSLPKAIPSPSTSAGLYIYPRTAPGQPRPEAQKVSIPADCLAFQTGEALELLTGGKLAATPHFVSGNSGPTESGEAVSRETFAFFLQPDVDDVIGPDGETFGAFTKRIIDRHYESTLGSTLSTPSAAHSTNTALHPHRTHSPLHDHTAYQRQQEQGSTATDYPGMSDSSTGKNYTFEKMVESSQHDPEDVIPIEKVVILYASETGNSQDTAERIGREFRRYGKRCTVTSMELFDVSQLPDTPLVIFVTSTHGRGDPPPAMLPLWTALLRSSLPTNILADVSCALYGLGDSSYEKFCYAGKMLGRRLSGLGTEMLGEPMWGDERAPNGIEDTFVPWLQQTLSLMLPLLPTVEPGFTTRSELDIPPPLYTMEPASLDGTFNELRLHSNGTDASTPPQSAPPRNADEANGHEVGLLKPHEWSWATLVRNTRITEKDWWQDVREIELEFEDTEAGKYLPGSICSLQPRMSAQEVNDFLHLNGLAEEADTVFYLRPANPDQPLPPHLPTGHTPTSLRSLLTNHLDLRGSPRRSFFEWMRRFVVDERESERLDEFLSDPDEVFNYATRPSRTVVESLGDFREMKLPKEYLCEILPSLRRRQFSMASSSEAHPGKVQLLVALVEYKTNLRIPRRGLCSSWLDSLAIGTRLPIGISAPTLAMPTSPNTPVILVGPGTGVAPMRAFLEYRISQGAASNTILYFGCRSAKADLYYADEWEAMRKQGVRVKVAASRDQESKIYVQDLIKRDRALIHDWVKQQRGHVYISGSSNAMPKEVRASIAWCLTSEGAGTMTEEEAGAFVEEMFEDGRGGEESW